MGTAQGPVEPDSSSRIWDDAMKLFRQRQWLRTAMLQLTVRSIKLSGTLKAAGLSSLSLWLVRLCFGSDHCLTFAPPDPVVFSRTPLERTGVPAGQDLVSRAM